jgi:hypothetical protein
MKPIAIEYKRNKWYVLEDYIVVVKGEIITVPEGFKTDLASVPRLLWAIFPPFGAYNSAAVVHDFLYREKRVWRKTADGIFLSLMKRGGVGFFTRWSFYLAVRSFGWVFY